MALGAPQPQLQPLWVHGFLGPRLLPHRRKALKWRLATSDLGAQVSSCLPVVPRVFFLLGSTQHLSRCLQGALNAMSSGWLYGPSFPLLGSTGWVSPLLPAPSFLRPPTEHPGANSGSYLGRDNTVDYSLLHHRTHCLQRFKFLSRVIYQNAQPLPHLVV